MNTDPTEVKEKELTEKIIGIFYKVFNALGYGFLEKIYENAMIIEFEREGVPIISQAPIKVSYEGKVVGEYFADMLVDGKVIVEIKAGQSLAPEHESIVELLESNGRGGRLTSQLRAEASGETKGL